MAQGSGSHGGGSGSGTGKTSQNITKTVSEVRSDATWWGMQAGGKTPYALLEQFR